MNLDKDQLALLFSRVNAVLRHSDTPDLQVNELIVMEHSQEGGLHRVSVIDALRTAVNGRATSTSPEDVKKHAWYDDTDEFLQVANMAVGAMNRTL